MDLAKVLAQLRLELDDINATIATLEKLDRGIRRHLREGIYPVPEPAHGRKRAQKARTAMHRGGSE